MPDANNKLAALVTQVDDDDDNNLDILSTQAQQPTPTNEKKAQGKGAQATDNSPQASGGACRCFFRRSQQTKLTAVVPAEEAPVDEKAKSSQAKEAASAPVSTQVAPKADDSRTAGKNDKPKANEAAPRDRSKSPERAPQQQEPARAQDDRPVDLPPQVGKNIGRKTLVLDMDETLIHSSFRNTHGADIVITVELEGESHHVFVLKRPGVDEFLVRVAELYEVVVYTASMATYANPLLDKSWDRQ
eukprot:gnl/TRDRNA2_/TRDRNA2_162715_c0_seq4.p1 gnl/TRDRNA2_/TRDRNA2_162715_c0~~gnl/TRDRNA2_/TRDRNA2_162715_c0_seq4.p1  ORF type:complete len:263 (-),score=59.51 gnl/TRDRNA2_/TRDRNA2_162715_c0_seq4:84-818(-)